MAQLRGLFVLLLLGFASVQVGRGQAWVQPKGHAYVKLSRSNVTASEQYRFDGERSPYADNVEGDAFFDESLYLYGEFGLTDNLTLVVLLPYKSLRVRDAAFDYETEGFGSVMIGLRTGINNLVGLTAEQHTLAANFMLTLPSGYTRNFTPSVGPGQIDFQTTINYGISLWPFPGYMQAGFGYRYRSALYGFSTTTPCQEGTDINCFADAEPKYDDELLFSGEAGINLGRWALLQVIGFSVLSNKTPDAETTFSVRNPIPTRQRYLKVGGGLTVYPLRKLGLGVQAFFTPSGRNTIRSTDIFWGVEYRI
ncbi:MAG: hypothetical protein IH820_11840 [Bacteroidetes bacterium]|nr:hypothetical protein [Bacteroidota bacterium]